MRFRCLVALAALALTTGAATAQPKDAGPTVELRLRSVNDLVDKFEYVAGLAGKEDAVKQVRELIKVLSADGKGIEGIDPKQPMGAYVTFAKEVENSPIVVMIPIADKDQFLNALKARLDVDAKKADGGTYAVPLQLPQGAKLDLHVRFANGYLYASPKAQDLDVKALVTPKAFFANDDGAVASLNVHIDRIPADLKTFVMGQIELGINTERKKNADNESAAEKRLKNLVFDGVLAAFKGLTDDGKELSVKLFADAKTDDLTAEIALTAKSGSATAKNFAALGNKTSLPAGIVASANPVARANMKIAITDGMKKEYAGAVDDLLAEVLKKAPADQEQLVKQLIDAVSPTLKTGELDVAAALTGPNAKGHYSAMAAFTVAEGKKIEQLVKDVSVFLGGEAEFKFDEAKVGDFNLHKIDIKRNSDGLEKVFGTSHVWLAVSDKCIAVSLEPDGTNLKAALKAKPAKVAVASVDVSVAKLIPMFQPDLKPDELKALLKDAFGDANPAGKDTIRVSIEGGEKLSIKLNVKGKALRAFAGAELLKGK
jgi:hypothetical protein